MPRAWIETSSFVVLVVLVSAGFIWLLLPFFGGVLWAVILAIVFRPLFRALLAATGGRANVAAALSLLACVIVVLIPAGILLQSVLAETEHLFDGSGGLDFDPAAAVLRLWEGLPAFVTDALARVGLQGPDQVRTMASGLVGKVADTATGLSIQLGQGTVQLAINLGIMLYTLFFLFRDGPAILSTLRRSSPLSAGHTDRVMDRFASVVRATVKGNVIIAVVQGFLGGAMFWFLGIQAALLWTFVMMILSLLPVAGAAIVWFPFGIFLLVSGDVTKGLVLLAYGTLVISVVDNLMRPALVGRDLRLPDYVVLISTVGGIAMVGANGFVVGPMIAALFFAVWSLMAEDPPPEAG